MRIESHQDRRDLTRGSGLHRPADQLRVPAMNTVEHADRQNAPPPVRGYGVETSPPLHGCQAYANMRPYRIRVRLVFDCTTRRETPGFPETAPQVRLRM